MLPKSEVCYAFLSVVIASDTGFKTPQGTLLNNFISGSVGGFVGTALNTP